MALKKYHLGYKRFIGEAGKFGLIDDVIEADFYEVGASGHITFYRLPENQPEELAIYGAANAILSLPANLWVITELAEEADERTPRVIPTDLPHIIPAFLGAIALAISLMFAAPAAAQVPMPDRSVQVGAVVEANKSHFADGEDGRREILRITACTFNPTDGGNWGRLLKKDRNPVFMPADILVWRPTMEHVDMLTDSGPMWTNHGPTTNQSNAWAWDPVKCDGVTPPPTTEPPPPIDSGAVEESITNLQKQVGAINGAILELARRIEESNKRIDAETKSREDLGLTVGQIRLDFSNLKIPKSCGVQFLACRLNF